jgi:hypothetical protein
MGRRGRREKKKTADDGEKGARHTFLLAINNTPTLRRWRDEALLSPLGIASHFSAAAKARLKPFGSQQNQAKPMIAFAFHSRSIGLQFLDSPRPRQYGPRGFWGGKDSWESP